MKKNRNSASSPYWWSVQIKPYRDVFEIGGSTWKKVN